MSVITCLRNKYAVLESVMQINSSMAINYIGLSHKGHQSISVECMTDTGYTADVTSFPPSKVLTYEKQYIIIKV